jgi:hypothetical protein
VGEAEREGLEALLSAIFEAEAPAFVSSDGDEQAPRQNAKARAGRAQAGKCLIPA